jgi:hypothetical protein
MCIYSREKVGQNYRCTDWSKIAENDVRISTSVDIPTLLTDVNEWNSMLSFCGDCKACINVPWNTTTFKSMLHKFMDIWQKSARNREYGRRDPSHWPHGTLFPQIVGTNFEDKRRSLGRYSSFTDWGHGFFFLIRTTAFHSVPGLQSFRNTTDFVFSQAHLINCLRTEAKSRLEIFVRT